MYDELTQVDIQKMRDEIDYRTRETVTGGDVSVRGLFGYLD